MPMLSAAWINPQPRAAKHVAMRELVLVIRDFHPGLGTWLLLAKVTPRLAQPGPNSIL